MQEVVRHRVGDVGSVHRALAADGADEAHVDGADVAQQFHAVLEASHQEDGGQALEVVRQPGLAVDEDVVVDGADLAVEPGLLVLQQVEGDLALQQLRNEGGHLEGGLVHCVLVRGSGARAGHHRGLLLLRPLGGGDDDRRRSGGEGRLGGAPADVGGDAVVALQAVYAVERVVDLVNGAVEGVEGLEARLCRDLLWRKAVAGTREVVADTREAAVARKSRIRNHGCCLFRLGRRGGPKDRDWLIERVNALELLLPVSVAGRALRSLLRSVAWSVPGTVLTDGALRSLILTAATRPGRPCLTLVIAVWSLSLRQNRYCCRPHEQDNDGYGNVEGGRG